MNHNFNADIDESLELTRRLRAQTRRLMEETERLARRPAWLPWTQAVGILVAAFLVAHFVIK